MKLLIDVEEAQIDFMLDLLSKFDFVTIDTDINNLTEQEKVFIDSRIKHHQMNLDKAVYWEDLKNQLEQTL